MASQVFSQQHLLGEVLCSFESYKSYYKKYKQAVSNNNKECIIEILNTAKTVFQIENPSPIILLNCVRILKDSLDTSNEMMRKKVLGDESILKKLFEIACFRAGDENEERGELYFNEGINDEEKVIGNSLLHLSLECFIFWPLMFPQDSEKMQKLYKDLEEKQVTFPEEVYYFKSAKKQLENQVMQKEKIELNDDSNQINQIVEQIDVIIQKFGELVLVPTAADLNQQEFTKQGESLKQLLEKSYSLNNYQQNNRISSILDRSEELYADYLLLGKGEVKFDDFSLKYGNIPISTNEIILNSRENTNRNKLQIGARHAHSDIEEDAKIIEELEKEEKKQRLRKLNEDQNRLQNFMNEIKEREEILKEKQKEIVSKEEELQKQNEQLLQFKNECQNYIQMNLELKQQNNVLEQSVQSLQIQLVQFNQVQQVNQQQEEHILQLQAQNREDKSTQEQLLSQIADLKASSLNQEEERNNALQLNEKRLNEREALLQERENKINQRKEEQQRSRRNSQQNEDIHNNYEELNAEIQNLKQQIEYNNRIQNELIKSKDAAIEDLISKNSTLKENISINESQKNQKEKKIIEALQQQIQEFQKQFEERDKTIDIQKQEFTRNQNQYLEERKTNQAIINDMQLKNQELQIEVQHLISQDDQLLGHNSVQDTINPPKYQIYNKLSQKIIAGETSVSNNSPSEDTFSKIFGQIVSDASKKPPEMEIQTRSFNSEMNSIINQNAIIKPIKLRSNSLQSSQIKDNIPSQTDLQNNVSFISQQKETPNNECNQQDSSLNSNNNKNDITLLQQTNECSDILLTFQNFQDQQQYQTSTTNQNLTLPPPNSLDGGYKFQTTLPTSTPKSSSKIERHFPHFQNIKKIEVNSQQQKQYVPLSKVRASSVQACNKKEPLQTRDSINFDEVNLSDYLLLSKKKQTLNYEQEEQNFQELQYRAKDSTSQAKRNTLYFSPAKQKIVFEEINDSFSNANISNNSTFLTRTINQSQGASISIITPKKSRMRNNQISKKIESSMQINAELFLYNKESKQQNMGNQMIINKMIILSSSTSPQQIIPYKKEYFKELYQNLSIENLTRFKKACIQTKQLLYEDEDIKVGVTSSVHFFNLKKQLRTQLYFFKKKESSDIQDFSFKLLQNQNSTVSAIAHPEILKDPILFDKYLKQDIIFELLQLPYSFPKGIFTINSNKYSYLFPPCSLIRFLNFERLSANQFKSEWRRLKDASGRNINQLESEEFETNGKIYKNYTSILNFFDNSVEINCEERENHLSGLSDYIIGSKIVIDNINNERNNQCYLLLQFTVKSFNKLFMQIRSSNWNNLSKEGYQLADYILQTLYFLFRSEIAHTSPTF